MATGLRNRSRSIVAMLALGTVESLISRLESFEDLLLDSSDPSDRETDARLRPSRVDPRELGLWEQTANPRPCVG